MVSISVIGPNGSGKTHFYTLLAYHLNRHVQAQTGQSLVRQMEVRGAVKTNDGRLASFFDLYERLRFGYKLPSTAPPAIDEGPWTLQINFTTPPRFRLLPGKKVQLTLLDLSGEVLRRIMSMTVDVKKGVMTQQDFDKELALLGIDPQRFDELVTYAFRSDIYIYVINLYTIASLWGDSKAGVQIPDIVAKYANFLDAYKFYNDEKPPKALGVVFTFFDKAERLLMNLGLITPEEIQKKDYSQVARRLGRLLGEALNLAGATNVEYFISYTRELDENRFKTTITKEGEILLDYPASEYDRIISWLAANA